MSFPITVKPDESLKIEIHLHQFYLGDRDRLCWTYLTHGMTDYQQREMALSLLVDDGGNTEDFPKMPIKLFQLLAEKAQAGQRMENGDSARLGQRGIFGFPCLFTVSAIGFSSLPSLDDYLGLILVHQEEYDYARQYGLTRFLSRLGRFCSSFPYPTWNTQQRPNLFPGSKGEISILANAGHVLAEHSHIHQRANIVQFQLHQQDAPQVTSALEGLDNNQIAILNTAFSPRCDASLYWQEGQKDPGAYAAPEATTDLIGGSFVSIGFSDSPELSIVEDGYSVILTPENWIKFCDAIRQEQSFECQCDSGRFILNYIAKSARPRARPYDPVAVWRRLGDNQPNVADNKKLKFKEFIDLSGESSLSERVGRDRLDAHIERIRQVLADALSEETTSFTFHLDLTIYPDRVEPRFFSDADLNPEFIQFIEDTVKQIPSCEVTSQIRIRLPFSINVE